MRIERVEEPLKLKDELVRFVFRVYQGTGGAYPALEWVENKPSTDDFEGFRGVYEPFLEFRLGKEFDELYVLSDGNRILGTVALVYNLEGKDIWWVPEEIRNEKTGLIEFLMVSPEVKGHGYGSKLLSFAVERLKELGKEPYVITFPELEAYEYYLWRGFKKVMDYKEFVVLKKREVRKLTIRSCTVRRVSEAPAGELPFLPAVCDAPSVSFLQGTPFR